MEAARALMTSRIWDQLRDKWELVGTQRIVGVTGDKLLVLGEFPLVLAGVSVQCVIVKECECDLILGNDVLHLRFTVINYGNKH